MRKLLKEISVIPGVTGSCIFDKKDGPLCKDIHPDLSEDLLQTVGIHLVRLIQMGKMSDLDVQSVHFRYDKYTVVGMPLSTGAVLMTICDAHANCSLVATTAAMLAADMREELDRGVVDKVDNGDVDVIDVAPDDVDDGALQVIYEKIEEALAGVIGPVAGIVMQDYLNKWQNDGPEIPARLSELVSKLADEIGDADLAEEFTEKIQKII